MTPLTELTAALRGEVPPTAAIVDLAEAHRVDALLAAAAHPATAIDVLGRLQRTLAAQQALTALRDAELSRVLDALAAERVPAIVIKGAHLRHALYRAPALRPSADTDLVVSEDDRERVSAVLHAAGYARAVHVRGTIILGQTHFQRQDRHGVAHALDVHWRLVAPLVFRHVLPLDVLRASAVPIPALGPAALGPSWPHALIVACIHLAAHHREDPILLWLHDVSAIAARLAREDQDAFARTAIALRVSGVCAAALGAAREHFDHPALEDLASRLSMASRRGAPEPSLAVLSARGPLQELRLDVRAAEGWRETLTLLREHLYPDAEYMRACAGGGWLPGLYARRALSGAARWVGASASDRSSAPDAPRAGSAAASAFPPRPGTTR